MRRLLLVLPLLLALPAHAERTQLAPPASMVGIRLYGMGFFPLDGKFTRFAGALSYDPSRHGDCRVELQVEAGSLTMSDTGTRDEVAGPEFMDVARFPALSYSGACAAGGLQVRGMLTMHGVTHPLALQLTPEGNRLLAEGRLRRADWGMTARPFLGGSTVRIQVSIPLPSPVRAQGDVF